MMERALPLCLSILAGLAGSAFAGVPTYTYLDSFGSAGNMAGQFDEPECIALNPQSGQIYVTDRTLDRVAHFLASGGFINQWGTTGNGNTQFDTPYGIAVDSATGKVYVVDQGNSRLSIYLGTGAFDSVFGSMGAGQDQFSAPIGLAVSQGTDQIYVSENGNSRVQRLDLSSPGYLGQWGSIGGGDGEFVTPGDIAVSNDGSTVYVTDFAKHNVQVFDAGGFFKSKFGGPGAAPGKFASPFGLTIDAKGRIYVADINNDRVQVFSADGTFLTSFGTSGSGNGQMDAPQDVVVAPSGLVYVVDNNNHRIQRWQLAETNVAPVVTLKGKSSLTTPAAVKTIRGTTADADGDTVTVKARVNNRRARVTGTTTWRLRAPLRPGNNRVSIRATDSVGANSPAVTVRVFRES